MNCAYHVQNAAAVNCNGCGKPLCSACDHRIKGFPFCQDCIVSGVQLLRNQNQSAFVSTVKRQTSPFMASLLSLICPGLGAAYNGQTSKALVYFAVFAGLFQMAVLSGGMAIFVLGFLGMWLFAALDSYRTAQILRSGLTPNTAEDIIFQRFSSNPKLWGIVLTVLGASFFLQTLFNLRLLTRAVLPVLLIGLGVYLLRGYVLNARSTNTFQNDFTDASNFADFSNTTAETDFPSNKFNTQNDFETKTRVRTWKNR